MFKFLLALTIISLIGLIIFLIMLISEHEHFTLWFVLTCVCGVIFCVGAISGVIFSEEDKDSTTPIIQEEQIEENHQYNYCPYCGKEIK